MPSSDARRRRAAGLLVAAAATLGPALPTAATALRPQLTAEVIGLRPQLTAEVSGPRPQLTAEVSGPRPQLTAEVSGPRPQLTAAQAALVTPTAVLGGADGWAPLADDAADVAALPAQPRYLVSPTPLAAAAGQRVFATLPAALAALQADLASGRHPRQRAHIGLAPGRHAGPVIVPALPVPLTLLGLGDAPQAVRLQADTHAGLDGAALQQRATAAAGGVLDAATAALWAPCVQRPRIGTGCSAVLQLRGQDVQLRRLTVANTHGAPQAIDRPGASPSQQPARPVYQAVALMAAGADRLLLADVRLWGHQDTLYLRRATPAAPTRVAVLRSLVAGDVDFIFGNATVWFQDSEILWLGERGTASGFVAAPSTPVEAAFGFVFQHCRFTSDGLGLAAASGVALARQWFEGARCSPYALGQAAPCPVGTGDGQVSPAALAAVGRMLVLHSQLGGHLRRDAPWADWQADARHPQHRPAQWHLADGWARLQRAGIDPATLGWPAVGRDASPSPWLAEWANHGPGAVADAAGRAAAPGGLASVPAARPQGHN